MIQIGIDFGGTKIEAAALDDRGQFLTRVRTPNPGNYESAIRDLGDLIARAEQDTGGMVPSGSAPLVRSIRVTD